MNRSSRAPLLPSFALILAVAALGLPVLASDALAQDLGETDEVVWSLPEEPDLLAKASQLATPVAIYEFVRNEIDFEPTYGSIKGAVGTLAAASGNAFDQASLLIALLRVSGIPARYQVGDILLTPSQASNWVGSQPTHQLVNSMYWRISVT